MKRIEKQTSYQITLTEQQAKELYEILSEQRRKTRLTGKDILFVLYEMEGLFSN